MFTYVVGSSFTTAAMGVLVLAFLLIRTFSTWSWMQAPLAGGIAILWHTGVVVYTAAVGPSPAGSLGSAGAGVEISYMLFVLVYASVFLIAGDVAAVEKQERADFRAELSIKMQRETSRKLVRSLVPVRLPLVGGLSGCLDPSATGSIAFPTHDCALPLPRACPPCSPGSGGPRNSCGSEAQWWFRAARLGGAC